MSVPAWMAIPLSTVLYTVAVATSSAQAERDMKVAAETGELSWRFDKELLPATTSDGREVWREFHKQLPCAVRKLYERGLLKLSDDDGNSFGTSIHMVEKVCGIFAGFTKTSACCHAEVSTLAAASKCSPSSILRVAHVLEHNGFGKMYGRISPDDRKVGGATEACTDRRSTVRVLGVLPAHIAAKLTPDEILDLIARGDRAPEVQRPAGVAAPGGAAPPRAPPPPPRPEAKRSRAPAVAPAREPDPHFTAFAAIFATAHRERYGEHVSVGGVGHEGQDMIAAAIQGAVGEARAWAAQHDLGELEAETVRVDLCGRIAQQWLMWPGTNGFLRNVSHALRYLIAGENGGDLPVVAQRALSGWKDAQRPPGQAPLEPPGEAPDLTPEQVLEAARGEELFDRAAGRVRAVSPVAFDQWFGGVQFEGLADGLLHLRVQNGFVQGQLERFLPGLVEQLAELTGAAVEIAWVIDRAITRPVAPIPPRGPP